jgi:cytochrome P450
MARVARLFQDARNLLIENYERFGPVFTLRLFVNRSVFMIGPEANHYITVTNAPNFTTRESHFRNLITIVGDGVLTTDGEIHRGMRRLVMPAFHTDSLASYFNIMLEEIHAAVEAIEPGTVVDIREWVNTLVLRVSTRTLFGLDPDSQRARESGLAMMFDSSFAGSIQSRLIPGPLSPWNRMIKRLRELDGFIYTEISERRARGIGGKDIVDLLIGARDEQGDPLTDLQVRDQLMTLLLASTGTTTATMSFLIYELARHPDMVDRILAEQRAVIGDSELCMEHVGGDELVELEMAMDETLRIHPTVWIGPRRSVDRFEFAGVTVPAGAYVDYSPLATHYLPDLYPDPDSFRPERFAPEAKAALPKGAYVPFGAGQRGCIGMRFAKLEIRIMASLLLERFELSLPEDFTLSITQVPMLAPKGGLPVRMQERVRRPERELEPA